MSMVVSFEGTDEIARAFERAPQVVLDELESFMDGLLIFMSGEIQERTPTAMGTLRASFIPSDVVRTVDSVTGAVGSALPYALPVELGTKPHMPPIAPLQDWVKVKLGLTGPDGKAVAYAIARKISKVGTQGAFMVQRAFDENRLEMQRQFSLTVSTIKARIAELA